MKSLALLWLFTLAPFTFAENANTLCPKTLKSGWETAKPFQFKVFIYLKGFDIDTLQLVLRSMGCSVNFEELPWERHLKEVENGTVDIASGASKTPERSRWGHFTKAYSGEAVLLFTLKENSKKYKFENE